MGAESILPTVWRQGKLRTQVTVLNDRLNELRCELHSKEAIILQKESDMSQLTEDLLQTERELEKAILESQAAKRHLESTGYLMTGIDILPIGIGK